MYFLIIFKLDNLLASRIHGCFECKYNPYKIFWTSSALHRLCEYHHILSMTSPTTPKLLGLHKNTSPTSFVKNDSMKFQSNTRVIFWIQLRRLYLKFYLLYWSQSIVIISASVCPKIFADNKWKMNRDASPTFLDVSIASKWMYVL